MSDLPKSPSQGTITKGDKKNLPSIQKIDKSAAATSPDGANPPDTNENPLPIEAGQYVKPAALEKEKSQNSLRTSEDGASRGREINDTLMGRLLYLQWSFYALILVSLLIFVLQKLHSPEGLMVTIGGKVFHQTVPVILELWMHICFLATDAALTRSLAAYFGYQLSQKHGYTLIICGFIQGSILSKIQFSNLLNFRSKYKKTVSRASLVWMIHLFMLILTFFSSTAITITTTRYDSGKLLCVEYGQDGVPVDRGWPNMDVVQGVAEFGFGHSLGRLSSQENVPNTTLITHPQLIDAAYDGTYLTGKGFTTNLQSTCKCSASNSLADVIEVGVFEKQAAPMMQYWAELKGGSGWVAALNFNNTNEEIYVTTLLSGNDICGGDNYVNVTVPVCHTVIGAHHFAEVDIKWMNDGVPMRSAPKHVHLMQKGAPASKRWLFAAVYAAFGGNITKHVLPGFYPGTVRAFGSCFLMFCRLIHSTGGLPLIFKPFHHRILMVHYFYAFLSLLGGVETGIAFMIKMGITRTYSVEGTKCVQNKENPQKTTLYINDSGYKLGLAYAIMELVLVFASFAGCVPWFLYKDPVIPAIRLVSDRTYFNIMLCKNSTGNLLRMIGATADRTDIWPKLDMEVRVGENIQTIADAESGEIIMDKPKLVTNLSWTKCY